MRYILTEETIKTEFGVTLHRIEAITNFGNVKKGERGGYVEKEGNLLQNGNAWVYGDAKVYGNAKVYGDAKVSGNAKVYGNAWVYGNACVSGDAEVYGDTEVYCNANVSGDAEVYGNAKVYGDADYIVFKNWWSSGRYFTWTRSNNRWKVGCFFGTGEELVKKAYEDSEVSGREYERVVNYVKSILNN